MTHRGFREADSPEARPHHQEGDISFILYWLLIPGMTFAIFVGKGIPWILSWFS